MLRATGFARLLGVLALLAGIVAMHSAVFAVAGHAAGAHGRDMPDIGHARSGHTEARPHRIDPGQGQIHTKLAEAQPNTDGTLPGPYQARPHHRIEPGDGRIRSEPVRTQPSLSGTLPRHARHRAGDGAQPGYRESFRNAGGIGSVTTVAGGLGQPIADAASATPWAHTLRPVAAVFAASAIPGPDCAGDGCDRAHSGMHGCVFILVVLTALIALVLLYRMAADRPGHGLALPRHWRPRRERPPPWTVLTLAELAILRI
ncbi:hypothetical protein AB0M45_15370 [Nocardia sp. NPDC051787]|uniref:hypothetical protein n=1 Tax=Nocardia sp. NPDC051787 TaxID=3155415 RepID=UPI003428EBBA